MSWVGNGQAFVLTICLLCCQRGAARDWPQILGPNRDGKSSGEELLERWPPSGPEELWAYDVGQGYAGVAVKGRQVLLYHRVGAQNRLECLDAADGSRLWRSDSPAKYQGGFDPDNGPRCVPLIHGSRVIALSPSGVLHCVHLSDGKVLWSRDLLSDFKGDTGYFGAGSTPIAIDDLVLVNVGGRDAGIVAMSIDDGTTRWTATLEKSSYASPILFRRQGELRALFATRMNLVALNPSTGAVDFTFPFGASGPTVNAATPLSFEDKLFLSASYGVGARLLDVSSDEPKVVWSNRTSMASQYTTCLYEKGFLYGTHGREDQGVGELRCVESMTGQVKWSERGFGLAHLIQANDRMLIWKTSGTLVLARMNAEEFEPLHSAVVFAVNSKALPALSGGRLFVRSNAENNRGQLKCLRVGAPAADQ